MTYLNQAYTNKWMSKSTLFFYALFAFILGVAISSFLSFALAITMGLMAGICLISYATRRQDPRYLLWVGIFVSAFILGVWRFHEVTNSVPDLSSFYDRTLLMRGTVVSEVQRTNLSQQLKVKIDLAEEGAVKPFLLHVVSRPFPVFEIGDVLLLRGRVEKPEKSDGSGHVAYFVKENIFASSIFPQIEKIREEELSGLTYYLFKIKNDFRKNINSALAEPHSSLLNGLLLGERQSLAPEFIGNLKQTGTTHIVALSGYNITLVGRQLINLLLLLTIPFRVSFWMATSAIVAFVVATGSSPSVVRAGIMGVLLLLAEKEGRMFRISNALVFAGALMIFQNPRILRFDAAFQLSFLATLGLVYLSPKIENLLRYSSYWLRKSLEENQLPAEKSFRPLSGFQKIFVETISAQLMVLPLTVFLFGQVSVISPLANILVLVAVPYAMGVGFLTGVSGFFSETLGRIIGWAEWVLLEYIFRIIGFFASFPWASVEVGSSLSLTLLAIYAWLFFKPKIKKFFFS